MKSLVVAFKFKCFSIRGYHFAPSTNLYTLSQCYGLEYGTKEIYANGVKNDSATNLALAFRNSFISEISLSTSSMN